MTFWTCAVTLNLTCDLGVAVTGAEEQLPSTTSTPGFCHADPVLRSFQVTLHSSNETGIEHAPRRRDSELPPLTVNTSVADAMCALAGTLASVSNIIAARRRYVRSLL